ncbi:MAG: phenylalanine--tRNA ligase subunit beta, partial [Leeuwenhoekiella sp.]
IAEMGIVRKKISGYFDIDQEVGFTIFQWDNIMTLLKNEKVLFKNIPKYPTVRRDFALLLDKKTPFSLIYDLAVQTERNLLKDINLFDVYDGDNIEEGKKSYAVSFTFQDEEKTLTDTKVDKIMEDLRKRFEVETGATLR